MGGRGVWENSLGKCRNSLGMDLCNANDKLSYFGICCKIVGTTVRKGSTNFDVLGFALLKGG